MKKIQLVALLTAFFAVFAFTGIASAYTLSLTDANGNPGDTIGLNVFLSLAAGDELQSVDFDVNYDDTLLEYTGVTWNSESPILGAAFYDATPPDGGVPPITFYLSFLDAVSSHNPEIGFTQHLLATIDFRIADGAEAGTTDAFLENIFLYDPAGTEVEYQFQDSTVTINGITPVPEPSTFLLAGAGIACLVACRRRKR